MKPQDQTTGPITNTEKQVAIAQAVGWQEYPPEREGVSTLWMHPESDTVIFDAGRGLPDYFSNLNAIREAELWMAKNTALSLVYLNTLYHVVCEAFDEPVNDKPDTQVAVAMASAPLRAEAFGRTLKLWPS
jgi:hypothetical protein